VRLAAAVCAALAFQVFFGFSAACHCQLYARASFSLFSFIIHSEGIRRQPTSDLSLQR
jgi:hypothetical protein